ncbi:helix-turn-helix domain-containing protein [Chryseobacterium sp. Ch-15]|uniref:Helix-turn-helix domain-containing protein n=1 Tax=Chryseobacterium muglaense TaxID=2893752 RepID=A0A9Q3UXI2_9FLAO|nr:MULTISPECIES: helix-turn-helix domain-containing protein [Chryseobacterium group]MBD3903349.1 helix-turn-helix domain-containing protein [Chryseobacterium muglaense]MBW3523310.1 helix-turn-helix domain-containing protein [Chryseobacterium sp. NKUCC03_KSP]MCC9036177.1 helix-turn-helix domain-containing protein [Chryseobacterium muglaense]MCM2553248.1 helix-turn-helix domain-containing protein [Chryseobacterium muglaense]VFA44126.1 Helix-turn-helix domain [Chryseobacterium indologenes]
MAISIITKEDLQQFKIELLEGIEILLKGKTTEQKLWLRSSEVKKLLNISSGTLQNLRINGTLSYSKIGGSLYYNYKDIQKLLTDKKH